jgi:hypothetical protein
LGRGDGYRKRKAAGKRTFRRLYLIPIEPVLVLER